MIWVVYVCVYDVCVGGRLGLYGNFVKRNRNFKFYQNANLRGVLFCLTKFPYHPSRPPTGLGYVYVGPIYIYIYIYVCVCVW